MTSTKLTFRVDECKTLKFGKGKLAVLLARASEVPKVLGEWRGVNPREVSTTSLLFKGILHTLQNEPEKFAERNRGLTIAADSVKCDERSGTVTIVLSDPKRHGVIDGAHSLTAVLTEPSEKAQVLMRVLAGVVGGREQIADIAGSLNRSQQVDLRSLENLRHHFDHIKKALKDEAFAPQIAYKQHELLPIDIRDILMYLAVFDVTKWDDEHHPLPVYGRREALVRAFAEDSGEGSWRILASKVGEILRLRDLIEKAIVSEKAVGRMKMDQKGRRIRGKAHQENVLHFLGETIEGKAPLGWIMPILGAFRANVVEFGENGTFEWRVENEELLELAAPKLIRAIIDIHQREGHRPEYVGRSVSAWHLCYSIISGVILQKSFRRAG